MYQTGKTAQKRNRYQQCRDNGQEAGTGEQGREGSRGRGGRNGRSQGGSYSKKESQDDYGG